MEEVEVWKPVVGYEGLYEVSSLGRLKRLPRTAGAGEATRSLSEKIMKPGKHSFGYSQFTLTKGGETENVLLHRLVLEAFDGPPPSPGLLALHGDGDPSNNRRNNLRWGTHKDNVEDSILHGTIYSGAKHHSSKLTDEDVHQIRRLADAGAPFAWIGSQYGIAYQNAARIGRRQVWRHLPERSWPEPPERRDGKKSEWFESQDSKLDTESVGQIRALRAAGGSFAWIVMQYGVCGTAVRNVCLGKTWRHVARPPEELSAV